MNFKQFLWMCIVQLWLSLPGYCESVTLKKAHDLILHKKNFRFSFAKIHFKKAYSFHESTKVHTNKVDSMISSHQSRIDVHSLSNKALYRALNKINDLNINGGAHLAHGGLRVGNFINDKTLVYVKARFIHNKETNTPLHSEFFKSLVTAQTQTTFNPSVGFEWKIPDNLFVTGELSNDFGQASPLLQGSYQINQSVLFNVRYQFDVRPRIDD